MDTKKQKVIKVLKRIGIALSIGFNVLFLIAIIVGSSGIKNKGNNVQVACAESGVIKVDNSVNKKFVSYDDINYKITISSNESNVYVFEHFKDFINNESDFTLASNSLVYSSYTSNDFSGVYVGSENYRNLRWVYQNSANPTMRIYFNGDSGLFTIDYPSNTFEYDITITIGSTYYEGVKEAIELDIQANSSNINDGIFETLTSGVVAFIGSLSSGITAMTSVFYDSANSQLTTIGLLSVIVVAISIAYFLFRLIIGLIRMRG